MPVKIGSSYVSEAAVAYAQNKISEDSEAGKILKSLSEQFKESKFSTNTSPFSSSGTNNIAISPNILRQMSNDPEKRLEYEALIYDCNQTLKQVANRPGLKAYGFIIDSKGGLSAWSISGGDDGKQRKSILNVDKDKLAGRLPKKSKSNSKDIKKNSPTDSSNYANVNEFSKYLSSKFNIVKNGQAEISSKTLREALSDENKRQKLFDNLTAADDILRSHDGEVGFQGMSVSIDEEGNMSMTSSKATVTFNESKRAAQLAAAKTVEDIRQVMDLLKMDLEDCQNGLKNNMCDEAEVAKVEKMIERAKELMNTVAL